MTARLTPRRGRGNRLVELGQDFDAQVAVVAFETHADKALTRLPQRTIDLFERCVRVVSNRQAANERGKRPVRGSLQLILVRDADEELLQITDKTFDLIHAPTNLHQQAICNRLKPRMFLGNANRRARTAFERQTQD